MNDLFKDVEAVLKQRGEDYGHFQDNFYDVARMWSTVADTVIMADKVLLCMVCLKLAREKNNPKYDNVIDMVGYLKLYSDMMHSEPEATPTPAGEKV